MSRNPSSIRGTLRSLLWASVLVGAACSRPHTSVDTYTNALSALGAPNGGSVENCPDPTLIHGQQKGDDNWYMLCTSDALNDQDRGANGQYNTHLLPTLKSPDLVNWTYVGDALAARPSWARDDAGVWAPDIKFFNGKYYLYYVVTETKVGGSAIAVATSDSPTGPWTTAAAPAVEPHEAPCCGGSRRWVFDPEVLVDNDGQKYIYYGSYFGGISVRKLSQDGLTSDPYSQVEVTVANRYEAASVIKKGDFYYLLASASDCCNGGLSGYSIFAGRSSKPTGPFVDREGVLLTTGRVGGTHVLGLNGNRWVGTGHNALLTDFGGRDWIVYHAIDRNAPYFQRAQGEGLAIKRHVLIDPLDWVDGWPTVRGGQWASDSAQPAPAAKMGEESSYHLVKAQEDVPGDAIASLSDEFDGTTLSSQWSWVRAPEATDLNVSGGSLHFPTQDTELFGGINNASVLTESAPSGDYVVETKMSLDVPAVACCFNYTQAGLVIYGNDDAYLKLVHFSNWETRQIGFGKEVPPDADKPIYGETQVGPADETVWLRIVKRTVGAEDHYTAYSSRDGKTWSKGGTWTHALGENPKIGLVSMSHKGFTATFDYVHVSTLKP